MIGGMLAVAEASRYSAIETLRDGRFVEIRAIKPDDRSGLVEAFGRVSVESVRRRFFAARRSFSEKEIAFFSNVDFVNHVALVAVVEEGGQPVIVGGGRYIIVQPGRAEIAFAVVDQYHGHGIGMALMRHLAAIAGKGGLRELVAEVLPENIPMLKVFEKSGLRWSTKRDAQVVHVTLQLS